MISLEKSAFPSALDHHRFSTTQLNVRGGEDITFNTKTKHTLHHFLLRYIILSWQVPCLRYNGVHFINQHAYWTQVHRIWKHVHYFATSKAREENMLLQHTNCDENKGLLIKRVSDFIAIRLQFWQSYSIEVRWKIATSGKLVNSFFKVLYTMPYSSEDEKSTKLTEYQAACIRFHPVTHHIQGVTGGTDQTSGECSLCQTIPI